MKISVCRSTNTIIFSSVVVKWNFFMELRVIYAENILLLFVSFPLIGSDDLNGSGSGFGSGKY